MKGRYKAAAAIFAAAAMSVFSVGAVGCGGKTPEYDGELSVRIVLERNGNFHSVGKVVARFGGEVAADAALDTLFAVRTPGRATVRGVYHSDANGERIDGAGEYITFELDAAETQPVMSTRFVDGSLFTAWAKKYNVTVSAAKDKGFTVGGKRYKGMDRTCDAIKAWSYPLFDKFTADTYTHEDDGITLGRAVYKPDGAATDGGKNPMIVWLHGAGEGGDDISLPLLAYDTVGLADGRVQKYFTSAESAGAYVAVLQCPTYWLETADGKNGAEQTYTDGQPSKYAEAVSAAIDDIVERDADIDPDRIYIAGCSNGGFMTLKLAADYGDKYAAYVPMPSLCQQKRQCGDTRRAFGAEHLVRSVRGRYDGAARRIRRADLLSAYSRGRGKRALHDARRAGT